jgi:outer membrane protein assembly factor BamB
MQLEVHAFDSIDGETDSMKATDSVFAFALVGLAGGFAASFTPAAASDDPPRSPQSDDVEMIVPGGEAMNYWSRWRGPSGQGIVEGDYPDAWSATENVLWKVAIPGQGHSSPIVWADKLFLTSASGGGSKRSLFCFNRADGKLLWEKSVQVPSSEQLYPKNSHASATPSTDGERVYVYFGNGGLLAYDMNGEEVWRTDFGEINLYHGPGGSPLLYKDRIILYQEQRGMGRSASDAPQSPGFMVAIDKKTGEELWRNDRNPQPGWGTPIAIRAGDRDEIIVNASRRVESFDPMTGKLLWFARGNMSEVIPTAAVGHGLVFCSSGRAGPTFAIQPGGWGDVTETRVVWSTPRGSPFVPSPLVMGEYLYTVNDMQSVASAFHAPSGETIGQIRVGEARREGFSASPIGVGGKVFFTNDDGETFVLSPAPDFRLLHVNRLGERTLATPALVDGKWYFRTDSHLICIGVGR